MKAKVFLSLPITGKVDDARREAATAKRLLEEQGFVVVTPFECAPDPNQTDGYYMGRCIETLLGCDMICQHPDWRYSRGCNVEHVAAKMYDIQRIEWPNE